MIGGLIVLIIGLAFLARYSKKKDPTETDEGRVIPFDDPEHRIGEDNLPDWKQRHSN
jgi:hypothetical protein